MNRLDTTPDSTLATAQDGMDQPIDVPMCATLGLFMTRNPQYKLFAIDNGTRERCEVRLGENGTLQARIGRDWLAVSFHERRFRLDDASLALFRQTSLKENIGKCPETQGAPAQLRATVSAGVVNAVENHESDVLLRSEFGRRLLYCFKHFALQSVRNGHFFMIDGGQAMFELMASAKECGFSLDEIFSPSCSEGTPREKWPKIQATWGDRISILLKRVLEETNNQRFIRQLTDSDRTGIGPFCICFNTDRRKIYIINRGVFINS